MRPRSLGVGYLPQEIDVNSTLSLLAYAEDVADDLRRIERDLTLLGAQLEKDGGNSVLLEQYGELQTRFEHLDGYTLQARAERILFGLGFIAPDLGRPLGEFSGGWRMRAALARILLREPDLVLLDEPTNHLDIVSLEWLEEYLCESSGAYLLVSHDTAFLNRVVTGVLALEQGMVVRSKGSYDDYRNERELREAQHRAEQENFLKRQAAEKQFIERFRSKATKARQVQSRLRRLEKEAPPASGPTAQRRFNLTLPEPQRSGRTVMELDHVCLGYGGETVHRDVTLRIDRGEKIALIGPNGAGKSTLLKALAGQIQPLSGRVDVGHNVHISYFAQHQLEQLSPERTVLEEMAQVSTLSGELQMRTILGSFLFSGDEVDKPVAVLSGGEKSRLVMAKMFADPGNLLLMDEPTNHLDIQACEVLKQALETFAGTLVLITHDRDLINRVGSRVLYLDGRGITSYLGNYQDYLAARRVEEAVATAAVAEQNRLRMEGGRSGRKDQRRREAERRERLRRETGPLRQQVNFLESEIERTEKEFEVVEGCLVDPEIYAYPERVAELARSRAQLQAEIDRLTGEWEAAASALEEREQTLRAEWQGDDGDRLP